MQSRSAHRPRHYSPQFVCTRVTQLALSPSGFCCACGFKFRLGSSLPADLLRFESAPETWLGEICQLCPDGAALPQSVACWPVPGLLFALISDAICSILVLLGLATRWAALWSFANIFIAWSLVHHSQFFGRGADHCEAMVLYLGGSWLWQSWDRGVSVWITNCASAHERINRSGGVT